MPGAKTCPGVRSGSGNQPVPLRRCSAALAISGFLGVDAFRRSVPLGFADRLEDASLGHAAEIAVDRRSPADRSHVEGDGLAEAVGIGDRLRASIVGFGYGVDGQRDAMRAGPT